MNLHNQINVSQRLALVKVSLVAFSAFSIISAAVFFSSGLLSSSDSKAGTRQKTIHGKVFQDHNRNQRFDQADEMYEGAKLLLYKDHDGDSMINSSDKPVAEAYSNHLGIYRFVLENTYFEGSVSSQVSAYEDDANELESGEMELNDNDLHVGYRLGATRFNKIDIPQGATIQEAYIEMIAQDNKSGYCTTEIFGELTANAETFTEELKNISSRNKTSEHSEWSPEDWVQGDVVHTPSLAHIVQEIVSQGDWNSGNSMAFIYTVKEGHRDASTREEHLKKGAILHVSYSVGLSDQKYVVKIDKSSLPRGVRTFGKNFFGFENSDNDGNDKPIDFPLWLDAQPIKWSGVILEPSPDNSIKVSWTVEEDEGSEYFDVEKSYDKENWFVLDQLAAQYSDEPLTYSSVDIDTDYPVVYYRIKRVDDGGVPTFTKPKEFHVRGSMQLADIYPVPANDFLYIRPHSGFPTHITVVSENGAVVQTETISDLYTLKTSALKPGVYFIRMNADVQQETRRILIQH